VCYNLLAVSRKAIFLSMGVLLVAAVALGVWYWRQPRPGGVATLSAEEGEVAVRRGSSTLQIPLGQISDVRCGDEIRTEGDSRALLFLPSGTCVLVEPDCEIFVTRLASSNDGSSGVQLQVRRGETFHQVRRAPGDASSYEILTPSAVLKLSAGGHRVKVSADGTTTVEVSQGVASVEAQDTEVEAWAGEYTSVAAGLAPSVPRTVVARYVFVSQKTGNLDIWLLDEEGRDYQLTHHVAADAAPVWSPDGTRIAFESLRDGNSEIYVMGADGSNQVNLTGHEADDYAPAWSADGGRLVFVSLRDGARDLYIMKSDGTEQARLTSGTGLCFAPHWDVAGSEIVFSRIEGDSNGDTVVDLRDMGAFFSLSPEGGIPQAFWDVRLVFDQMVFPWARRAVG
jgi:hypothetical protein